MKALLWIIGLIIVAVLVWYFVAGNPNNNQTSNQTQNQTQNTSDQTQPQTQRNSLKNLLSMGSQRCTFTDGQTQGTVLTANGKARMDMTSVANGVTTNMHAIIDNNTYYSWIDGQATGFKFSTTGSATGSAGSNQNVDLNKQIDYNCTSASADSSLFVLPIGVQFMELGSIQIPSGN